MAICSLTPLTACFPLVSSIKTWLTTVQLRSDRQTHRSCLTAHSKQLRLDVGNGWRSICGLFIGPLEVRHFCYQHITSGPAIQPLFNHCLSTRGPPSMTPTDRQRSDGEIWVAHQQLSTKDHGDADSGPLSARLDGTSEARQTNLRWSTSDCRCRTAGAADSGSLSGRHRLAIWV